jgi:hypothetical protein
MITLRTRKGLGGGFELPPNNALHPLMSKPRFDRVAAGRLVLCLAGLLLSEASLSQLTLVLISNYDIKLNVAGEVHHITNQAKVRNGKTIPIEFQSNRVDVTIDTIGDGRYRATVNLFERDSATWNKIAHEDLTFEAMFGAPVNLQWEEADISIDLAIAVSVSNQ